MTLPIFIYSGLHTHNISHINLTKHLKCKNRKNDINKLATPLVT